MPGQRWAWRRNWTSRHGGLLESPEEERSGSDEKGLVCDGVDRLGASGALAQRATQLPARPVQPPAQRPTQLPAPTDQPSASRSAPSSVVAIGGYPYPDTYASTPLEGALNGMGNVISSKGSYNLATSQAAINLTQAQNNAIQNHLTAENTYFQMREANAAYRAATAAPRPTEEQIARMARDAAPKPVSPGEVDPVTGMINWPTVLQDDGFAAQRTTLGKLSAKKAANGSLGLSDETAARKTIEAMFAQLKSQIQEVPPEDYVTSRNFLASMIYAFAHSTLS